MKIPKQTRFLTLSINYNLIGIKITCTAKTVLQFIRYLAWIFGRNSLDVQLECFECILGTEEDTEPIQIESLSKIHWLKIEERMVKIKNIALFPHFCNFLVEL